MDSRDLQRDDRETLLWNPFPNGKIQFFSDGNDDYEYILPKYYAGTCIDYGQVIKIRENGKVVDKRKWIVFGSPEMKDIETTNVENFNSILRERIGRLVRKTKCYSKKKSRLGKCYRIPPIPLEFHGHHS